MLTPHPSQAHFSIVNTADWPRITLLNGSRVNIKHMSDLKIATRRMDGVVILDLDGSIKLGESSAELHKALKTQVEEGNLRVVMNLENVTSIDSSGLGSMIAGFATLEKSGGTLKLEKLSPRVSELMTITKLFTVFEIFDTEQEAVDSFGDAADAAEPEVGRAANPTNGGSSLL